MKKLTFLLSTIILLSNCVLGEAKFAKSPQVIPADLVLRDGAIYTVNEAQPWVEAVAVLDGMIIFAGSNQDVAAFIDNQTTIIELDRKMVLPGLHDVHMHPLEAGSPAGSGCLLSNSETDPENFMIALQSCNLTPNSNGWIVAGGHSIFTLYDAVRPPREILDDVFPDDPVAILEATSHSLWVNSLALEIAGIDATTTDPIGGHIIKWDDGEPSGILLDNAGDLVLQMALASTPEIDDQNYEGLVSFSLPLLARMGITSICEGRTYWKRNYHRIWQDIKNDGLLSARVVLAPWIYPEDMDADLIASLQNLYIEDDDLLRINQVKCYSDGITINATAALHEPYNNNLGFPFDTGLNYIETNRLANLVAVLEQTGYDFFIHTIGDRGITEALDAIEFARNTNGDVGARHRLTHLEIVDSTDFSRFAQLNVSADVQVAGDFTNPENWEENELFLGEERSDNLFPLKSLHNAGARITLSSDWDVSTANPFAGMQHALTRSPQELPSLKEVIKAYTINAAYVMRQEDKVGSIEVDKYADLIIIDQNLFEIPVDQIAQTKVLLTLLAGKVVYRDSIITDIKTETSAPKNFILEQNFPNPFNAATQIRFTLESTGHVFLNIYNNAGALVRQLLDDRKSPGTYTLNWDGADSSGQMLSSGIYYYLLKTENARQAKKMTLVK